MVLGVADVGNQQAIAVLGLNGLREFLESFGELLRDLLRAAPRGRRKMLGLNGEVLKQTRGVIGAGIFGEREGSRVED